MEKIKGQAPALTRRVALFIFLIFIVWRSVLFGLGAIADRFLEYKPTFPYADTLLTRYDLPRWVYSWANFDGVHYITITEKGYFGTGLVQAFFPFYPWLLRIGYLATDKHLNTLLFGLIVSNIATYIAAVVWFGFLADTLGRKKAWIGLALFFCFPTALFWGAFYTESIFFAAVVGAFWAIRRQHWWLATLLTCIATSTRVVGIFLVPALFIEVWQQWQDIQDPQWKKVPFIKQFKIFIQEHWRILLLLLWGSAGLVAYMIYLYFIFNDPLYFLHVQSEFGAGRQVGIVVYPQVAWRAIKILLTTDHTNWRYYTSVLEFLAGSLGLLGLLCAAKKTRISYVLFSLGAFLLPTVTGTFSSMPRYILVCFPLYLILIEVLAERKVIRALVFTVFILTLIINTFLFVQGYWLS